MADYLLSKDEVRRLTGAVRRQRQLDWLTARGIRAELGADGEVKVLREAAERIMLPGQGRAAPRRAGPNLDALRKTG